MPVQEVQEEATRAELLRHAIICGGAVVGGAATLALPQLTSAASQEQDARVLNLVLAVEYTEAAFYAEALERGGLRGNLKRYAQIVLEHERAHVAFLKQALGTAADPAPSHEFGDKTKDAETFTAAAPDPLERTSRSAFPSPVPGRRTSRSPMPGSIGSHVSPARSGS